MNWLRIAAIVIVCSTFAIHLGQAQEKDKKEAKDKKDDKKKDDKKKDEKKDDRERKPD